jgi:hypothetical protein
VRRKHTDRDARQTVRKLIKAGKIKSKCCRSKSPCKVCPVLALMKAKANSRKAD